MENRKELKLSNIFVIFTILGQIYAVSEPVPQNLTVETCNDAVSEMNTNLRESFMINPDSFRKYGINKPEDMSVFCVQPETTPQVGDYVKE